MILAGNQTPSGQQVLITSSQNENQQTQAIKFLNNSTSTQDVASPAKTITLAQAQQMGLLSTNKVQQVQHILPSSPQKQVSIKKKVGIVFLIFMEKEELKNFFPLLNNHINIY